MDAALNTSALNDELCLLTKCLLDLLGIRLGVCIALYLHSAYTGHERFCRSQSILVQIRDDNGRRASSMRGEQAHHTNWTGSTDDERVAETQARSINAPKSNGKWLEESPFLIADAVWKKMQPSFRMGVVAAQRAWYWWRGVEDHVRTRMITTCSTRLTGRLRARDATFECDSVA